MTGTMKNKPAKCCCGCEPWTMCLILDDAFSSDTSANYDAVSGSWTIGSGYAQTADDNAVLVWNTDAEPIHSIVAYILRPVTPSLLGDPLTKVDYAKIIVGYADSDNYLFAKLKLYWTGTIFSPTFRAAASLWKREGGTETQLVAESTFTPSTNESGIFAVALCWRTTDDGYGLSGNLAFVPNMIASSAGTGFDIDVADADFAGLRVGAGTVTLDSAVLKFDRLIAYNAGEFCPHCFCQACADGTTPKSITLEFSGVANGTCGNCNDWNSVAFVIDRSGNGCAFVELNIDDSVDCGQSGSTPAVPYYNQIRCEIICSGYTGLFTSWTNEGFIFRVDIERSGAAGSPSIPAKRLRWELNLPCCKVDCRASLLNAKLSIVHPVGTQWTEDDACDWSNAMLTVTEVT